eukprot:SAG11_NODE_28128_length_325_cov_0.690265_1_plen_31_part_10
MERLDISGVGDGSEFGCAMTALPPQLGGCVA